MIEKSMSSISVLKISVYQYAPLWLDYEQNLKMVEQACVDVAGQSDLLLLPEMFNTGYVLDTGKLAPEIQRFTLDRLQALAAKFQIVIGGSLPMNKQGKWYNTFVFVDGQGIVKSYDKIQLFAPAGEKAHYCAGTTVTNLNYHSWNIQPLICYDLRFPYLSFLKNSPDLLIYSANWPVARVHHWKSLLVARAIENQCFVVGINRTGRDDNGYEYPGTSMAIDFNGQVLSEMGDLPSVMTLSMDMHVMQDYRKRLPFWQDRSDSFFRS